MSFPFLLQGITYKRAVFLDKTLLLLSDFEYSSVGIDDLAENGEKAVLQTYVSRNKEWGNDASLFTPIAKDFFILTDVYAKKIRLYHAAPQQELQEITSKSLPGVRADPGLVLTMVIIFKLKKRIYTQKN